MNTERLETEWAPRVLSLLRFVAALIFFSHGTQKLLGFPASDFAPPPFSLPWIAGVLELTGGALLIVGLFTRPVAFVLSGLMAFAYWMGHGMNALLPIQNMGELAALYCFVFLYISTQGSGIWSVDAARKRT